jgi:cob(I)alamin adenosyltransferase
MKIYTKTGDSGQTSLYGGKRVSKSDLQIEAYGVLDELNVYIGYIRSKKELKSQEEVLKEIQDRIFSIGAYLASDFSKEQLFKPELKPTDIELLEKQIDTMDAELPPLKYFVLPGGHDVVSLTHLARVVTRRAERAIVCFYNSLEKTPVEKDFILQYVNRLSDYLFVLSRFVAKETQTTEYHWKPRVS